MSKQTISFWISIPRPMSWWDRLLRYEQVEDIAKISVNVESEGDIKLDTIDVSDPAYIIPHCVMIEETVGPTPYVDGELIIPDQNPLTHVQRAPLFSDSSDEGWRAGNDNN